MGKSGRDTRYTLVQWDGGQESAERLSSHIISSEGYYSIDPIHPMGGRDGKKDMMCVKSGQKYIAACYFPRGQMTFSDIKNKFVNDLEGVKKNNAEGFVFVTNQEISDSERNQLRSLASHQIDIFHLERIINILNSPSNYGVRLKFLDIKMSQEELLSVLAWIQQKQNESINTIKQSYEQTIELLSKSYIQNKKGNVQKDNSIENDKSKDLKGNIPVNNVNKGDVYLADLGDGAGSEISGIRPVIIVSNHINNRYSPTVNIIPITSQITKAKLPTHVELGLLINPNRESVALAEQIKTISKQRLLQLITSLNRSIVKEIDNSICIQMGLVDF